MLLFRLSPVFKSLLVTPGCWLIWLVVIMRKFCYCYSPHSAISLGANTLRTILGLLLTDNGYTHVPLISAAVIQAMLLRGGCTDFPTEVQSKCPAGRVWIYKEDIQKSKPLHTGNGVRHEKKPMGCCKKSN